MALSVCSVMVFGRSAIGDRNDEPTGDDVLVDLGAPLVFQDAVDDGIAPDTVSEHVVAQPSLALHSKVLQDAPRRAVVGMMHSPDAMQAQFAESEANEKPCGLGRDPVSPMVSPDAIPDVAASIARRTDCEANHSDQAPPAGPFDTEVVLTTWAPQRFAVDAAEELLLLSFARDGFIRHEPEKRRIRSPYERGRCIGDGIHLSKSHPISDEGHRIDARILQRGYAFDAELVDTWLPEFRTGSSMDRTLSCAPRYWPHRLAAQGVPCSPQSRT
jgi:hypothetical protein